MANIEHDQSYSYEVLKCLFQDALRKFGKARRTIQNMSYNVQDGFIVLDGNGVAWRIETTATVIIPDLPFTSDKQAAAFCPNCTRAMPTAMPVCGICQYLERI
jgi:hypothetical protein